MPRSDDQTIPVTTPDAQHQQAASNIASELSQVLGSDTTASSVIPTTADTPASGPLHAPIHAVSHKIGVSDEDLEQIKDVTSRMVLNKPGFEPSKSFLKKVLERVKKKNPGSDISLINPKK